MCGRFALFANGEAIKQHFGLTHQPDLPKRYNIAPGEQILAVCMHANHHFDAHWFKWGLIPSWAKDEKIGYKMINTRSETVAEKPAFKKAFRQRRCLVIVNGFYEWHLEGITKQPYYFKRKDNQLFAIAAIWEHWHGLDDSIIQSCSLLTTGANQLMQPIHERMPVIISPDDYPLWLDVDYLQIDALKALLPPKDSDEFEYHPVTPKVNNSRYNNSDAILPIT